MHKKVIHFLLAACILLGGCTSDPVATEPSAEGSVQPTESQTPTETMPEPVDFKINGNDLGKYTIVWAESEYVLYQQMYFKYLPEKDMYEECAERLQAFFREKCGVELDVISDKDKTNYKYEIYVGPVTKNDLFRDLLLGRQTEDDYRIAVVENRMVICGGEAGTTWHALDYFEAQVEEQLKNNGKVSFEDKYDYADQYHLIKIGMIGASSTQGSGSSTKDRGVLAYPNQIGRILWKDCLVYNYGKAGRTMRDDYSDSYMANSIFQEVLGNAKNMDIITIALGTNDGDRVLTANGQWTDLDDMKFVASCEKLVKSLCDRNDDLKFILCYCQTNFRPGSNYEAGAPYVRAAIEKSYNHLKDKGYNMGDIMDLGEMTKDMKKYFSDGLHPNDPGHKLIAERVAEYFKSTILGQ